MAARIDKIVISELAATVLPADASQQDASNGVRVAYVKFLRHVGQKHG